MKRWRRAWRRLLGVRTNRASEFDLAEEIAAHIQMQTEDNVRAGMSSEEAERAARLKFGGVEATKESYRDQRGLPMLESLVADLRYALRGLRRSPGFTATAVAALALGIGATTAVFSIVDTVLLKPLSVSDPDRFVLLLNTRVAPNGAILSGIAASPSKFAHFRAQSNVLEDVSAYSLGVINYTEGDVAEQWHSMQVSASMVRCLGLRILRGRTFTAQEDIPNGPHVAVLSEGLWTRRFERDPRVLGTTITLGGESYEVIGVMADNPAAAEFGAPPDVVTPFQLDPNTRDQGNYFQVVARLKPGVSLKQAQTQLQASANEYRARFPAGIGPKDGFTVMPFLEAVIGGMRSPLLVLLGAVGMVLLIACANVANLLLARGTERKREMAIRVSIGAGRGRMIRQLLTESLLLSTAGGALGLVLGFVGIRALLAVNTADLPRVGEGGIAVALDWRIAAFALALSLLTGLVFGLFPALEASRADVNSVLKDAGGKAGGGLRQTRARAALVMSEVGLAVVLLIGSALLIRTFVALYTVDRGFDTRDVATMRVSLAGPQFATAARVTDTIRNGLERIRTVPGVTAATATCCVPLQGAYALPFYIVGSAPALGSVAQWVIVSPGYFDVFKIPLKRGRAFTERDDDKSPAVVIISENLARQFWKDRDPLGDRIHIGLRMMKELEDEPVRQVVGIVGDVRGIAGNAIPTMYVPQAQLPNAMSARTRRQTPMAWVARTQGDPYRVGQAIQEQLRQATGLPVSDFHSMNEIVSLSAARQRFNMLLMTAFGGMALLLAMIGIYGLIAYSVAQRRREVGIRLALGARSSEVRNMVVRQGMALALAGMAMGLAAAWAMTRLIEGFLFGVKSRDPLVFVVVPALLGVAVLFAVWLPANRVGNVSPVESLRYE